ncbi:MAG TPA: hypothetical protein VK399_02810, partial [Longimicrobiaceae bacterium]|nr:hypothetical protein [Longimicrobiaceae bacterium]
MTKDFGEVLEEHTRRAASLWESVLRQLPAAAAVVDAESGRVVLASGRAEEDEDPPEFPGAGPGAALRPDGAPFAADEWPLARSLRTGETVHGEEVAFRREDGPRSCTCCAPRRCATPTDGSWRRWRSGPRSPGRGAPPP